MPEKEWYGLPDVYALLYRSQVVGQYCYSYWLVHLTPVEQRIHVGQPVPFLFWHKGLVADEVQQYDEVSCASGAYGLLRLQEFMTEFMKLQCKN